MNDENIKIEHTRLLISFYQKAYIAAIPFSLVLCIIFIQYVQVEVVMTWFALLLLIVASQVLLARRFSNTPSTHLREYRYWILRASVGTFMVGTVFGYASIISTELPLKQFYLVKFLMMTSITIFSACGFKRLFLAYAIPILISFGIAGVMFSASDGYFVAGLQLVVLALFYVISHYFERTLLESIKIRFEKNQLLDELKLKKDEAEQANAAKSSFLAAASHDLRQPLHALGLYLESAKTSGQSAQRQLHDKMAQSLEALNDLFDNLLDISKLDSGITQPMPEHFDIVELIDRVACNFESLARAKGLQLHIQRSSTIAYTDPVLLERVVSNLISNAIRYTVRGSVSLNIECAEKNIILTLADTGIGIPEHQQEKIFDEFYQLNNSERDRTKGLGLGLSIVRRLAGIMGLELSVTSEVGHGSSFTLSIPHGDSAKIHQPINRTPAHETSLIDLNILLIDDEVAIRDAMSRLLRRWGCQVRVASDLADAEVFVDQESHPDVIISDYRLKGPLNGVQTIKALHKKCDACVPALLITGDTSTERLVEASLSGHQLLHKPVNPGLLRESLTTLIKSHSIRARTKCLTT